jgi:hypothetical protein
VIFRWLGLGSRPTPKTEKLLDLRTSATWLWSVQKRIAHRPSCPRVGNLHDVNLRGTNDPDELRAATIDGCRICWTMNDVHPHVNTAHDDELPSLITAVTVVRPRVVTLCERDNGSKCGCNGSKSGHFASNRAKQPSGQHGI